LLDGCSDYWQFEIHKVFLPFGQSLNQYQFVVLDGIGNKPSFLKQLEMALDGPDDEFVYFAEDDYLYRPMAVAKMLGIYHPNFMGFYSPYDHIDRYVRGDDRELNAGIIIADGWHWRTAESTTMTFGAPRHVIKKTADIIREHACEGRNMWYPIIDGSYILWSPIPSRIKYGVGYRLQAANQSTCHRFSGEHHPARLEGL